MSHTEEIVDNLESRVSCGIIYGCYIRYHGIFSRCVVFEEGDDGDDARRWDVNGELILPDGKLLDVFR